MQTFKIDTIEKYFDFLKTFEVNNSMIFRGVADYRYKLIPSIGRLKPLGGILNLEREKFIIESFQKESRRFLTFEPKNDWEWLCIAQHYGVPTRLLDWSKSPLIATYFALENEDFNFDCDCAIYALTSVYELNISSTTYANPFDVKEFIEFNPPILDNRIENQKAVFTIFPNPFEPIEIEKDLFKFVIDKNLRKILRDKLSLFGIDENTIYPGLEGVGKKIKRIYYENTSIKGTIVNTNDSTHGPKLRQFDNGIK